MKQPNAAHSSSKLFKNSITQSFQFESAFDVLERNTGEDRYSCYYVYQTTYRIDLALHNPPNPVMLGNFPGNATIAAADYQNLKRIPTKSSL
jgi:hypothetical protein